MERTEHVDQAKRSRRHKLMLPEHGKLLGPPGPPSPHPSGSHHRPKRKKKTTSRKKNKKK
jgi:hypothetical protein